MASLKTIVSSVFVLSASVAAPCAAHNAELVVSIDSANVQPEGYNRQAAEPQCDGEKNPNTTKPKS